jgi:hypothetical protein
MGTDLSFWTFPQIRLSLCVFVPSKYRLECFRRSFYMKRRSARPFMVEVKSTRGGRASLTSPDTRTRPDAGLWPELAQAAVAPPQPSPKPDVPAPSAQRPEQKEPPARRVLPSLVPMFEVPVEPEPEPVAAPARRTRRERAPAVAQAARAEAVVEPAPQAPPVAPRPEPAVAASALRVPPAAAGEDPSPRPTTWRRTKELRLGERWKRRLPHYAR